MCSAATERERETHTNIGRERDGREIC
uniref:Uncharacterized protein n=1 Tax=Rhizophora mucronata TaxID=61149 RepID=A0A2P2LVZ2_RHIMU